MNAQRLALASSLLLLAACGGAAHIEPHVPRARVYDVDQYATAPRATSRGSLWPDAGRGLFADFRANRIGDIVTIRIDETANASGDASTTLDRESSMSFGGNMLGLGTALQRAYPDINPEELVSLMSQRHFDGSGETSRDSHVQAAIAVRVKQSLPNGDLFVEGTKVVLVNDEELHIYISGVIRPEDIEPDNSVRSSLVADAEIELTGRGALSDNQERGWLVKLLDAINPF
jgi:flagellar L-ring protein precursor FlgH